MNSTCCITEIRKRTRKSNKLNNKRNQKLMTIKKKKEGVLREKRQSSHSEKSSRFRGSNCREMKLKKK